jgi:hypothetical protein
LPNSRKKNSGIDVCKLIMPRDPREAILAKEAIKAEKDPSRHFFSIKGIKVVPVN